MSAAASLHWLRQKWEPEKQWRKELLSKDGIEVDDAQVEAWYPAWEAEVGFWTCAPGTDDWTFVPY
jgi:hypothetical protein